MTKAKVLRVLKDLDACPAGMQWVSDYWTGRLEDLWCGCDDPHWMKWLVAKALDQRFLGEISEGWLRLSWAPYDQSSSWFLTLCDMIRTVVPFSEVEKVFQWPNFRRGSIGFVRIRRIQPMNGFRWLTWRETVSWSFVVTAVTLSR